MYTINSKSLVLTKYLKQIHSHPKYSWTHTFMKLINTKMIHETKSELSKISI